MVRKSIAIGCIFFGAVLIYLGYEKTQSVMGSLSRSFSGGYSTETIAYIAFGGILVIVGVVMVAGKRKRKR